MIYHRHDIHVTCSYFSFTHGARAQSGRSRFAFLGRLYLFAGIRFLKHQTHPKMRWDLSLKCSALRKVGFFIHFFTAKTFQIPHRSNVIPFISTDRDDFRGGRWAVSNLYSSNLRLWLVRFQKGPTLGHRASGGTGPPLVRDPLFPFWHQFFLFTWYSFIFHAHWDIGTLGILWCGLFWKRPYLMSLYPFQHILLN